MFRDWEMIITITWSMLRDVSRSRLVNDNHSQFEAVKKALELRAWDFGLRDYLCIGLHLQVT